MTSPPAVRIHYVVIRGVFDNPRDLLADIYELALSNDPQLKIDEATFNANKEISFQEELIL